MKRHKRNRREIRKRILILCEGKTEKNYFQAIKEDPALKNVLSAIHPEVVTAKNSSPEKIVKEAVRRVKVESKSGNPYDKVWLIFDHDNHKHRKKAYMDAQKNQFEIAFSAISFEMWYLLHFSQSSKAFASADNLISELKKHYPGYEKAKQNDFANLKEKLPAANVNSKWLRDQVSEAGIHLTDYPAWTDVDCLVLELLSQ